MYGPESRTIYALTRWLIWRLFAELRSFGGNIYRYNTRACVQTVRRESTYISIFLTRGNEYINDDKGHVLFFTH